MLVAHAELECVSPIGGGPVKHDHTRFEPFQTSLVTFTNSHNDGSHGPNPLLEAPNREQTYLIDSLPHECASTEHGAGKRCRQAREYEGAGRLELEEHTVGFTGIRFSSDGVVRRNPARRRRPHSWSKWIDARRLRIRRLVRKFVGFADRRLLAKYRLVSHAHETVGVAVETDSREERTELRLS